MLSLAVWFTTLLSARSRPGGVLVSRGWWVFVEPVTAPTFCKPVWDVVEEEGGVLMVLSAEKANSFAARMFPEGWYRLGQHVAEVQRLWRRVGAGGDKAHVFP